MRKTKDPLITLLRDLKEEFFKNISNPEKNHTSDIFLSYAWVTKEDLADHPEWEQFDIYKDLATLKGYLEHAGFTVYLDKRSNVVGHKLNNYMEKIESADTIICFLTPVFKAKSENEKRALFKERDLLETRWDENPKKHKIQPYMWRCDGENNDHEQRKRTIPETWREKTYTVRNLIGTEQIEIRLKILLKELLVKRDDNGYIKNQEKRYDQKWAEYEKEKSNKDSHVMVLSELSLSKKTSPRKQNDLIDLETVHYDIYKDKKIPVYVYCDPGIDDMVMLAQLLSNSKFDVKAIVACAGNTSSVDVTLKNVLYMCELCDRTEIKVYKGRDKPSQRKKDFPDAKEVHGDSGLGHITLPNPKMKHTEGNAADIVFDAICNAADQDEQITLISTANLTDLYFTLKKVAEEGEEFFDGIATISMMGGVLNIPKDANAPKEAGKNRWAEFNLYCDPKASHYVFDICEKKGVKIFLAPTDLTHQYRYFQKHVSQLRDISNPVAALIVKLLEKVPKPYLKRFSDDGSQPVHDLHATMCLANPIYKGKWVSMHCDGSFDEGKRGKLTITDTTDKQKPNVFLLVEIPEHRLNKFYAAFRTELERFSSKSTNAASHFSPKNPSTAQQDEEVMRPRIRINAGQRSHVGKITSTVEFRGEGAEKNSLQNIPIGVDIKAPVSTVTEMDEKTIVDNTNNDDHLRASGAQAKNN